ncbi:MAG TPA: hypothetical protein VGH20_15865 [Myxococcales bacterium]
MPQRNWVREAIDSAWTEARSFCATAFDVACHPGRFGADWVNGGGAMNPLGFFATSLAVVGALGQLDRFWPEPGKSDPSLAGDLLDAAGPYLHATVLALLVHAVLRVRGSRRSALDSVAAALYGAGVAQVLATAMLALIQLSYRKPLSAVSQARFGVPLISVAILGPSIFFAVVLVLALAAMHRVSWRWPAVALIVAWILTGVFMSAVHPPGKYGLHPVVELSKKHVSVGLGM